VDLTAAGQLLLDRGRQIVNDIGTLEADVYQVGKGATGVLRVGFSGSATYGVMPQIARLAKQVLPGLSLALNGEMLTPSMEAGLRDGTLDAALLRPPVSSQEIDYRVVAQEPLVVAVPSFSALAEDRSVAMHELQDQDFIAYAPESVLYRITSDLCRQAGFQPRITQVVGETSTMLAFVAAGGGVAVMPSRVRAFQLDGVAYREIENVPSVELAVAWLRGNHSTLLQNFLDVVGTAIAAQPLPDPAPGPVQLPTDERLSQS